MAARKGWGELSPPYRKRLEGAGIDRQAYESGANLNRARGHAVAAPEALRQAAAQNQFGPGERQALSQWRRANAPKWLGDAADVGDTTAALISELPPASKWAKVVFEESAASGKVRLNVTLKNGERASVILPDVSAAVQVLARLKIAGFSGLQVDATGVDTTPGIKTPKGPEGPKPAKKAGAKKKAPAKKAGAKKAGTKKKAGKKAGKKTPPLKVPAKKTKKAAKKAAAPPLTAGIAELLDQAAALGLDAEALLRAAIEGRQP